jgi:hypothetical protein
MWGRKGKRIERLERRVEELEDIVCPNGQHKWAMIERDFIGNGFGVETIYKYRCGKCHRVEWDFFPPIRVTQGGGEVG